MNLKAFDLISNKVLSLANNMNNIVKDVVKENRDVILDLNKIQLESGIKNDSTKITPKYKPSTIAKKKAQGKEFRWVTLEDKGDFKRGMKVDLRGDDMLIFSSDSKSEKLKEKYSKKIFGLTKPSLQELRIEIKPLLLRRTKRIMKL